MSPQLKIVRVTSTDVITLIRQLGFNVMNANHNCEVENSQHSSMSLILHVTSSCNTRYFASLLWHSNDQLTCTCICFFFTENPASPEVVICVRPAWDSAWFAASGSNGPSSRDCSASCIHGDASLGTIRPKHEDRYMYCMKMGRAYVIVHGKKF